MEKVILGDCKYLYLEEKNIHTLMYDPDDTWVDEIKGTVAMRVIDTGNDVVFNQIEKGKLDYSKLAELKFLLNKIK